MKFNLLAWSALALAALSWCGVAFFAYSIAGAESDQALSALNDEQVSNQKAVVARIHALALDTAQDRSSLLSLLQNSVVSVASAIQGAGKSAGVSLKLSSAQPENAPEVPPGGPPIQAVGFAVEADGSFPHLVRAAELLESLPLPSSIQRLNIERTPGTSSWHLDAYLIVLTASYSS